MLRELALEGVGEEHFGKGGMGVCERQPNSSFSMAADSVNSISSSCRLEETARFFFSISRENLRDIYF